MAVAPLARSGYPNPSSTYSPAAGSASLPAPAQGKPTDWTHLVAAGTVVTGGALMISGHKKAGLAVAAMGTVLALLEEPEAVETWWKNMPRYLSGAQELLDKVEHYLEEASVQGKRIRSILNR